MGTILGSEANKIVGVAPDAKWIGCRNMANGDGSVATYLECFEFFLAPYPAGGNSFTDGRPEYAPHIINNSWACPTSEGCVGGEFLQAIRSLAAAGIATVVAASNDGPSCGTVSSPPAIYAGEVLAVGAYNHYLKDIAFFSSRGPSSWNGLLAPNLIAPGSNIHSAVHSSDSAYDEKSGTSMASPHVAGAVALLWSAKPELIGNVEKTFDILQKTATPMTATENCGRFPGNQIPNAVFGYGMLNVFAAVQAAP
jgi:serine protease AprX